MIEPIWKEISKKEYNKALRKYGFEDDNFTVTDAVLGSAFEFRAKYQKRPVYRKYCGIMAIIDGSGIIGYKYFRYEGSRYVIGLSKELMDELKEAGIL